MAGGEFRTLFQATSRSSLIKLTRPIFYNPIKNYGQANKGNDHGSRLMEERAPSTAEEFKRVAEEKLKETEQGVASQTVDKTHDAAEEQDIDSVKNRNKEHEPGTDYRRKGD